ncbi:hypothetical protein RA2_03374 [Roseovarius sp. A-2]|uniref:hypothetical protein n=1 Tax=Roseovarius sp. A-2 TaxID=1570360 RepID=UPI0009D34207|nr:hypothetical protein [Roseovarius sp. A-2]GAW36304.1 hypothetical protein RA2_03374 [Roseovarius sp. A-2]
MHRKFIAFIIGSAMTVTSLAASPVAARDRGETAAIVAGVAALAVVGATLASDRKHKGHVSRGHGYQTRQYAPRHRRGYQAPNYRRHQSQSYRPNRSHGYRPQRSHGARPYGYRHGGYNAYHRYGYGR